MAELVDAPASGAGARKGVEVRRCSWAPHHQCLLAFLALCNGLLSVQQFGLPQPVPAQESSNATGFGQVFSKRFSRRIAHMMLDALGIGVGGLCINAQGDEQVSDDVMALA